MKSVELVILVGIQASGKTTYYRRHLAGDYLHVSLDNWRGSSSVRSREREAILAGLKSAADSGGKIRGVVVDNTNTTAGTRHRYFVLAEEFSAQTGCQVALSAYFFDADLESCLARNAARPADTPVGTGYFVPPAAIRSFHARLEPPELGEGFTQLLRVRIADGGDFDVAEQAAPGGAGTS